MAPDAEEPPRRAGGNREIMVINPMKKGKIASLWLTGLFLCGGGCGEKKLVSEEKPPPESPKVAAAPETANPSVPGVLRAGNLEFSPAVQHKKAEVGTTEVEFVYMATNLGTTPITITKVDSGCACIQESVDPKVVPPGGSARISAVYATERISGTAEKIIAVSTDQPNIKDAFLTVKLEMAPIYRIDPELSTWSKGSAATRKTVTFEVVRDTPIHLLEAKSSRSEITATVEEVEKGKKYLIHLQPSTTASNMLGMVRLITDCEIESHARPLLYVTVQ